MELNERDLVLRTLSGDRAAYGTLVDAYQGMVFAAALNITGSYEDSSDVVQEAFLRAYQKLPSLADPGRFASWLYTIARRVALKVLRENRRVPFTDSNTLLDTKSDAETPAEAYARKELSALLWDRVGHRVNRKLLIKQQNNPAPQGFKLIARRMHQLTDSNTLRLGQGYEYLRHEEPSELNMIV